MKNYFFAIISILLLSYGAWASIPVDTGFNDSSRFNSDNVTSPQVCQFSLSTYTGKISGSRTEQFTVGLSCPQEETMRATVGVFIDGELIASLVVEISAKATKSSLVSIGVPKEYNGKTYRLVVE